LLDVTNVTNKLLNGLGLLVLVCVALRREADLIDQDVGIGSDTSNGDGNVVVDTEHLVVQGSGLEQLGGNTLLGSKNNTTIAKDSYCRSGMADGLHGVLHLVQTTFRREDRCSRIVSAGLQQIEHAGNDMAIGQDNKVTRDAKKRTVTSSCCAYGD
jgi:hypothetical protein